MLLQSPAATGRQLITPAVIYTSFSDPIRIGQSKQAASGQRTCLFLFRILEAGR